MYIYIENAEPWTWAVLNCIEGFLFCIPSYAIDQREGGRKEEKKPNPIASYNTTSFHEISQSLCPIGRSEGSRALASSPPFKEVKQVITPGYITLGLCQTLCHPLKKEAAVGEPRRGAEEPQTFSFGASPCLG